MEPFPFPIRREETLRYLGYQGPASGGLPSGKTEPGPGENPQG